MFCEWCGYEFYEVSAFFEGYSILKLDGSFCVGKYCSINCCVAQIEECGVDIDKFFKINEKTKINEKLTVLISSPKNYNRNVETQYNPKRKNLIDQIEKFKQEGRKPVIRMRMPEGETVFVDAIRGEVKFEHKFVPDFVLARADGSPLYTLAVAVDDVLMKIG